MSTTDRPIPFHTALPGEADDLPFGEPGGESRNARDSAEGDRRSTGNVTPFAPPSPSAGGSAPGADSSPQDGASNELAASLTDRLIQFWRTGEMGDGEFLHDDFYDAPPGEKSGTPGGRPGDDASGEGASVLDFLPRRGPLPDLKTMKQRQGPPTDSHSGASPAPENAFGVPGFGMFGPSSDPFAAPPISPDENRAAPTQNPNSNRGADLEFRDLSNDLWGRPDTITRHDGARQDIGRQDIGRHDDEGVFGEIRNSDRLGFDAPRTRNADPHPTDLGRRGGAARNDSLWSAEPLELGLGQASGSSHSMSPHQDGRADAFAGGHEAFERIPATNPYHSDDRFFGEGFEMYRDPSEPSDRKSQDRTPQDRTPQERMWDDHDSPSPAATPRTSRRGPLPRQNAPVVTQEERSTSKRKPVLEVAFIYGSALALAAAVMGAIYLSNEGRKAQLGQAAQLASAPMSGMSGMGGMYGSAGMSGMNGMGGMNGAPGYGGMAGGPIQPRPFEVHDVVGFPSRPIALSIVLPKPLGETDAFLSIGGLPEGAQLSAGTRMASGFWMLRFEDIEGLTLKLPESSPAEIQAEAAILRQDGSRSFERNFRITNASQARMAASEPVTAAAPIDRALPAAAPVVELPKMAPDAEKAVLGRANVMLEQGDISAARLMLEHGAVKGCVECGFKLAQICDPLYLSKLDVWGVQPDIEKALKWYAWSARYGHPKASEAHGKLKQKILSDIPGN